MQPRLHPFTPTRIAGLAILAPPVRVAGAFPHNPDPDIINGSLWTIPCEFVMYVLLAGLGILGLLGRRWVILVSAVGSLAAFRIIGKVSPAVAAFHLPVFGSVVVGLYLLTPFLLGIVFYLYADRIPRSGWVCVALLAPLLLMRRHGLNLLFPVAGTYATFYVAFTPRLDLHRFARYGDFSYGLYLYAYPIQQVLVSVFPGKPVSIFLAAVPLSFGAAWLSWHLVEKPCLKLKWRGASQAPAAAASPAPPQASPGA